MLNLKNYDPKKKKKKTAQYTHHILNSNLKVLHSKKNNNFTT